VTEGTHEAGPKIPPGRWPSTWPALWGGVRDRAVFVGAIVVLTLAGTALLGDLGVSWWVPFVPLLLMIGPATRPGRVRRRFERAAARKELSVHGHRDGWRLRPGGRRGHVVALISRNGEVTYVD